MAENYIYAVARIRVLEMALFTQSTIEQLLAVKSYQDGLQFLRGQGWGDSDTDMADADAILNKETEKTWSVIREMVSDMSIFDVILIPDLYHNLKAAIKTVTNGDVCANIFCDNTAVSGKEMVEIIKNKDFKSLPKDMQECAKEAYDCLVHTGDGQMCDVIIDRGALKAIIKAAYDAKDSLLKEYAETMVAVADIKIAVRSAKTSKSIEFMKRAMAECESIDTDRLADAAVSGLDDVIRYLGETDYAGGAEALCEGPSAFERWCDNRIIETIRPQKYNSSTVGPLAAYIIARQNEIKTVRIILTGKLNNLPDEAIRERIREMYV